MGVWQNLFEYGVLLRYYQILKGSVPDFTEKMTHNLYQYFLKGAGVAR